MKIVECVPNFSEGQNKSTIEAIGSAIKSVNGVNLLDVDPGHATNRTVLTFAGAPENVLEAAFQAIKTGCSLIDMHHHRGEHPRQGACDVCPFVPVSGVTMDECVKLAKALGKRIADELDVPVFLYAEAAARPERKRLPDIREGEYEALKEKFKNPQWKPDFGPAKFIPKTGAITVGARKFLIAYNINLNTTNARLAKNIASTIRETGSAKKGPGLFNHLQATGWMIPEYGQAQITMNILNIDETPVHTVFDKCCELASQLGCRVTGSEIVGMVPKQVLLEAGKYFLKKQGATLGIAEEEIIKNAITTLGLNDVAKFDPKAKIIEERFMEKEPLVSATIKDFCKELGSNSPAPGGGSVAALSGALSAALSSMVAALTFEKKGFEEKKPEMEKVGVKAQELLREFLDAVDKDTMAFNKVMKSFAMPKKTEEQIATRKTSIEEATKNATLEPLGTLKKSVSSLEYALEMVQKGNPNSLSDAGVAGLMAEAGAFGAYYNVLINLGGISDKKWTKKIRAEAGEYIDKVKKLSEEIKNKTLKALNKD